MALTAGLQGGSELSDPGLVLVASLHGMGVFALWLVVHRRAPSQVARDVDDALELEGALFTAWEAEGSPRPTRLARQLALNVASGASHRKMMRASLPATLPLLAVPLAALALLVNVLEDSRSSSRGQDLKDLAHELEQGLSSVAGGGSAADGAGEELSVTELRDLNQLVRKVGSISDKLAEGEAQGEELAQMAEELAEMESLLGPDADESLRNGLRRAQTALDAGRMAQDGDSGPATAEDEAEGNAGPGRSSGSSLASTAEDGRILGSNSPSGGIPPGSTSPAAGVLGIPSWPRAHDEIVRRWVEFTRRSTSPR
jgi:hypothetical protein